MGTESSPLKQYLAKHPMVWFILFTLLCVSVGFSWAIISERAFG